MNNIRFSDVSINGGFWKAKRRLNREKILWAVYDRFIETGRFEALKLKWKEGMPHKPHIFWDSDVAKWMESAAYLLKEKPSVKIEKTLEKWVSVICKNQEESGYFNSYYQTFTDKERYSDRNNHELYCAGHLMEAAVAHFDATGRRNFLDFACKYADYIEKRFVIDRDTKFVTPGHEEIELALIKLYKCTGEKRYLDLCKFFIDQRGNNDIDNAMAWCDDLKNAVQSNLPVRELELPEGHAVRAVYLYSAMADLAYETGDKELFDACERLFDRITEKRMYITGAIGSTSAGEAFTIDYDLPNHIAYAESCASIGLVFFAVRMQKFGADSKYADIVERVLYNGFLSSFSLDGTSFFYVNPLEVLTEFNCRETSTKQASVKTPPSHRYQVFNCSCCPPNITRFLSSLGNLIYGDDGETLYVHQFMESSTTVDRDGKKVAVDVKTKYPDNGKIDITVSGGNTKVAVRIPSWCTSYKGETVKGYAYFDVKDGETLSFDFEMKTGLVAARPEVDMDCGRYAVVRGPVVYCTEALDNGMHLRDIRIPRRAKFRVGKHSELGVPTLTTKGFRTAVKADTSLYYDAAEEVLVPVDVTFIPYYAFANRTDTDMLVWHLVK